MADYSRGKIYIIKTDLGDECYIGSTTKTLTRRFTEHSYGTCSSKIYIDIDIFFNYQ